MPWCPHCFDDRPSAVAAAQSIRSPDGKSIRRRFTSCSTCGRVLKDRPSRSPLDGNNPKSKDSSIVHDIADSALNLTTYPDHDGASAAAAAVIVGDAQHLFNTALEKEKDLFARKGHRVRTRVAAACLYVELRRHRKPYMLIDLSNYLGVTVYVLCAMFVALTRVLMLRDDEEDEHAKQDPPFIDPSLFMHRISSRLLVRDNAEVAATALRILSTGTSKDWMLSRQKQIPIKLCSAALYIAANSHSHGENGGRRKRISKTVVVSVVRAEFESMKSSCGGEGLTMDEFVSRVADFGSDLPPSAQQAEELVCRHKNSGRAHCCHGLCRGCCGAFVKISKGGAFYNAKRQRTKHIHEEEEVEVDGPSGSSSLLDDVDDREINSYINTREEKQYKTVIWDLMNKDYVEDRAAAVAAALAVELRKEKKHGRAGDRGGNAAKEKQKEKMVSSRINYEALAQLQEEEKRRAKTDSGGLSGEQNNVNDGIWDAEAVENYDEADGDGGGDNGDEDDDYDYLGDYDDEDYSGHYADTNDDDDFGF